ncbi:MAG: hypothetical protein HY598_01530 [Candidatus Omnitrophica bacterium]|nr:hypothetical protein [Candidatus Omnitrophota bacterium]
MKKPALALPKLAARERMFAAIGVLMVALVVLDRLLVAPWWRHTQQVAQDIRELRHELATHERLLSRQTDVGAKIDAYRDYLRIARSPEVEMGELIRELELLAAQSGVTLGTVSPLPTTQNAPYQEHAVDVQYQGTLEQAVRFLYLIESSKKLFEVQRATMSLEKRGQERLQGSLRLTSVAILAVGQPAGVSP